MKYSIFSEFVLLVVWKMWIYLGLLTCMNPLGLVLIVAWL